MHTAGEGGLIPAVLLQPGCKENAGNDPALAGEGQNVFTSPLPARSRSVVLAGTSVGGEGHRVTAELSGDAGPGL